MRRRVGLTLVACAALGFGGCGSSSSGDSGGSSSSGTQDAPATSTPAQSGSSSGGGAKTASDSIKDFTFTPGSTTVKAGGTVSWTNKDAANHNVTFDDKSVKGIGNLRTDQSGKVTFDKAGTYAYVCTYHPGMKGTVVVK